MKTSIVIFFGGLLIALSSFVNSHSDIKTIKDLGTAQNFFGAMGVIGGCLISWAAQSPANGRANAFVSRMTGGGTVKLPVLPPLPPLLPPDGNGKDKEPLN